MITYQIANGEKRDARAADPIVNCLSELTNLPIYVDNIGVKQCWFKDKMVIQGNIILFVYNDVIQQFDIVDGAIVDKANEYTVNREMSADEYLRRVIASVLRLSVKAKRKVKLSKEQVHQALSSLEIDAEDVDIVNNYLTDGIMIKFHGENTRENEFAIDKIGINISSGDVMSFETFLWYSYILHVIRKQSS